MKKAKVATINNEPWWASVGLNHVAKLWVGILETSRWMRVDGVHEKLIKVGSLELGMACAVDLNGKFEDFGDVFAGDGASHNDWCVWDEVEIIFEVVENFVTILMLEVGLGDDENDALARVYDLACEALIEFGMRLGAIYEHAANVCLFDSGEAAECGELFDANFAFAWLTETGGIE